MKTAIIILSDPKPGSEEALGRVFNALAAAYDFQQKGEEVTVLFNGTGTRWAGKLTQADHPLHDLYRAVEDTIAGVSAGCAQTFGAAEEAEQSGFDPVVGNPVPGTAGLPSLQRLMADGYQVLTF